MTGTQQLPQRIIRLAPLADVLAALGRIASAAARERPVAAAQGRALAADVLSGATLPAHAVALRDGLAVRAEWSLDASSYAPALLPSEPVRVDSGEALPDGADAVAPFDAVELDGSGARMTMTVAPGDGVLPAGADAAADMPLLRAGTRLAGRHAALLTAAGIRQVSVRAPHILLAKAKPDDSRIVAGALAAVARDCETHGCTAEAGASLSHALAAGGADATVAVGGTGSGRDDRAVTALAEAGKVLFHGIGIGPGETTALGLVGARPVLLLPGRLDAALAAWLLIGRPMMARLSGATERETFFPATLTRKVAGAIGLAEVVPVRLDNGEAEPLASGTWPLAVLARANGWILLPAASEGHPAGARVEVRPLP